MRDHVQEATSALEAINAFMATVPDHNVTATAGEVTLTNARPRIGDIVRAAGFRHQRTSITDHGERTALVVHPEDWENLIDALAAARSALTRINNTAGAAVTADEARHQILGRHAA
jgi:hypothetical protein